MPASTFSKGDSCWLKLELTNPGVERSADLYLLLDVFADYWSYPGWAHISQGLNFEPMTVPMGQMTLEIIPLFTMPPVSPAGPLYFCAAMFEPGTLSLETMVSNGAIYEFRLQ